MYVSVFILKVCKVYIYSLWLSLKSVKAFTINISYNHEVRKKRVSKECDLKNLTKQKSYMAAVS